MKIAIPSIDEKGLDSEVCEHFGQSNYYTIIEIEKELPPVGKIKKNLYEDEECRVKVIRNRINEGHVCEMPVSLIVNQKVNYLLTSGIGESSYQLLREKGIKLYTGALGTVREALRDFLCGMLSEMKMASCSGGCGQ